MRLMVTYKAKYLRILCINGKQNKTVFPIIFYTVFTIFC